MEEKKKKRALGGPLLGLVLLAAIVADIFVAIGLQCLFVHTIPAPLTESRLAEQSYFEGCEILDIAGSMPVSSKKGQSTPNWVLYRDQDGQLKVVRIRWNLFVGRYRIDGFSATDLPQGDSCVVTMRDFLGKNEITVKDQCDIVQTRIQGGSWQQSHGQTALGVLVLALLVLESTLWNWLQNRRQKEKPAKKQKAAHK